MKTNKILFRAALVAIFVGFLGKNSNAENTTGNVLFDFWPNSQTKQVTMKFYWNDNQSSVTPVFYYDTIPNSYRFKYEPGVFTSQFGNVEYQFNYLPCRNYYGKVKFTDGSTGNSYQLFNGLSTPGNQKPEIKKVNLFEVGFNYLKLQTTTDGHCESFETRIYCQKMGESPILRYNEQNGPISNLNLTFDGLIANTQYQLTIEHENWLGVTSDRWAFTTPSNLPPVVDSKGAISVTENSVRLSAYLDTKNTTTKWGFELGENVVQEDFYGWNVAYGGEGMIIMDICNLKPNTIYFFRPVSKNDWGHDEGQTRIFKTNATTIMGVRELTFDDLLRVSSKTGGLTIFVEQSAEVIVSSINGQKIGTYNVADESNIDNLPVGTYVIQTKIGGKHLVKKAMVF